MALPGSGAISLDDIAAEFPDLGGATPNNIQEYYGAAPGVPPRGLLTLSDFYGKAAGFPQQRPNEDIFYFPTSSGDYDLDGGGSLSDSGGYQRFTLTEAPLGDASFGNLTTPLPEIERGGRYRLVIEFGMCDMQQSHTYGGASGNAVRASIGYFYWAGDPAVKYWSQSYNTVFTAAQDTMFEFEFYANEDTLAAPLLMLDVNPTTGNGFRYGGVMEWKNLLLYKVVPGI